MMRQTSGPNVIGLLINIVNVLGISFPASATVGWETGDMVLDFGVNVENGESEVLVDSSEVGEAFGVELMWRLDSEACHLQVREGSRGNGPAQLKTVLDDGVFGGNPAHAEVSQVEALLFSAHQGKNCSIEGKRDEFVIVVRKQRTAAKEGDGGTLAPLGATVMVLRATAFFTPNVVTIKAGERVVWIYGDGAKEPHSVTSGRCRGPDCSGGGKEFSSGPNLIKPGHQFEHIFTKAGTFPYHCDLHGGSMQGTVIVEP